METTARETNRALSANPNDPELLQKKMLNKIRMGETEVVTYYKIEQNERYLSQASHTFLKGGTRFNTKEAALFALECLVDQAELGQEAVSLVTFRTHTVLETTVEEVDCAAEIKKRKLAEVAKKRRKLLQDLRRKQKALDAEKDKILKGG